MNCLPFEDAKPNAVLDLFCLPYAGGSSAVFRAWDCMFPEWVSVRPIEYPGRGTRLIETRIEEPGALVAKLCEDIAPHLQRPWAIFGHSLGGALGYEIAKTLSTQHPLVGFFPSGRHGPNRPDPAPPRSHLPKDALIEEVRSLNGSPPEVLENEELLELILPIIRSDFLLSERISRGVDVKPLACPVHVFGGSDDPEVPQDTLAPWRAAAGGRFGVTVIEGDHFFLHEDVSVAQMRSIIIDTLAQSIAPRANAAVAV